MRPVTPGEQGGNANTTPSASIAAVAIEFPPHQVGQREALSGLTGFGGPQFDRCGVSPRRRWRRIGRIAARNSTDSAPAPAWRNAASVELRPAEAGQAGQCLPLADLMRWKFDGYRRDGRGWRGVGVPPLFAGRNRAHL